LTPRREGQKERMGGSTGHEDRGLTRHRAVGTSQGRRHEGGRWLQCALPGLLFMLPTTCVYLT
jgi:hypothetical protein